MENIGAVEISAGLFGTASVSFLIFLIMQSVKDFVPRLADQGAAVMVHLVSLCVVALVLVATDADWRDRLTWVALVIGTFSAAVIARGYYAQLFKVSVSGIPPSVDATVPRGAVHDPQADDARPMTSDELREAFGPMTRRVR